MSLLQLVAFNLIFVLSMLFGCVQYLVLKSSEPGRNIETEQDGERRLTTLNLEITAKVREDDAGREKPGQKDC